MNDAPFRTAMVGCRGMATYHAAALSSLPDFTFVAACDLNATLAREFAAGFGVVPYTDYAHMLAEQQPDVVVVVTTTVSHAPLTLQAVEAGARGVFCEKPMAINLGEAQAMLDACRAHGASLVVNHQRRTLPTFRTIKHLLDADAIGEVVTIRGSCAGDVLSDGTHLIDTIRYLAGDAGVAWVVGQIHRDPPEQDTSEPRGTLAHRGRRYGHPVETGALALWEFSTGVQAELRTGSLRLPGSAYQHYEIEGTRGRIRRPGDAADPQILLQTDDQAGWRPVPLAPPSERVSGAENYRLFARMMRHGSDHPLSGLSAYHDQEIVMAIYESARRHGRVTLPLRQPEFPLELMLRDVQRG
jgi:UDP-N-acetyl-2-amino-2-deoxyglucuronate dehydrogenase